MIGKAFWLTIYSVNFMFFCGGAFAESPVFGLHHRYAQGVWVFIATLTGWMLYREIRKATAGEKS